MTEGSDFEQVLLVCDRQPTGELHGPDRWMSELVTRLRTAWPSVAVTVVPLDVDPLDPHATWLRDAGIDVVAPPVDVDVWLRSRAVTFSLILVSGRSARRRMLTRLRASQPQAMLVAVLQGADVQRRRGQEELIDVAEERLGARWVDDFEAAALRREVAEADAVLLDDAAASADALAGLDSKVFRFDTRPASPPTATGGPGGRAGVLLLARGSEEFGEPDEEALELLLADAELLGAITPLRIAARGLAPSVQRRLEAIGHLAPGPLSDVARAARVLLAPRAFGGPLTWEVHLARSAGTPLVRFGSSDVRGGPPAALDVVALRSVLEQLLAEDGAWSAERDRLVGEAGTTAAPDGGDLVDLLCAAGFAPPVARHDGAAAVTRRQTPFSSRTVHGGSFQRQVTTKGWTERRPMNPVMQRADVPLDLLWPQNGYAWWHAAHPLPPPSAESIRRASASFELQPRISIVMPVYNTPPNVLRDTLDSVRSQLYRNWQLCIADDASTDRDTLGVLDEAASEDPRIHVEHLRQNHGIAGASNVALHFADGDFVALLDHDDLLTPEALFEVVALLNEHPDLDFIYSDEDKLDEHGNLTTPFFKPSWSPDLHLCVNYVTHFAVYRRSILRDVGGFRAGFDGSQDYDLSLRVTERVHRIGHIAKPIYTWRMVPGSAATAHDAKPYAIDAARRALEEASTRRGWNGVVEEGKVPGTWRVRHPIVGDPKVSVLLPTRNGRDMLERCLDGLAESRYRNLEVVIIDNDSDDPATLEFLDGLSCPVVRYPFRFNYARQMNLAAAASTGDHLLFLNNDMEMRDPAWLENLVEHAQRPEVGAVGARLLFPSGRPQHEGVFVGFGGGCAGNVDFGGYFGLGLMDRNGTAVTAACMVSRREVFEAVGGFDERLRVAFNDVDYCLRVRQRGYAVVYTPHAELIHAESASRGGLHPTEDEGRFVRRWGQPEELPDPFYNPNLDPVRPFRLRR